MSRRVDEVLGLVFALVLPLAFGACAAGAGGGGPVVEPEGFYSGPVHAPVPAGVRGGRVIDTADLAELLQRRAVVLIDASDKQRPPPELAPGSVWLPPPHMAIAGSVWLPEAGRAELSAAQDDALRRRIAQLTQGDAARTVVAYCHERCWLSWNAAHRLVLYGYRDVVWYPAGIEGWRGARLPTARIEANP